MTRYNDPKTGKTVKARNAAEAKELLKVDKPAALKVAPKAKDK